MKRTVLVVAIAACAAACPRNSALHSEVVIPAPPAGCTGAYEIDAARSDSRGQERPSTYVEGSVSSGSMAQGCLLTEDGHGRETWYVVVIGPGPGTVTCALADGRSVRIQFSSASAPVPEGVRADWTSSDVATVPIDPPTIRADDSTEFAEIVVHPCQAGTWPGPPIPADRSLLKAR